MILIKQSESTAARRRVWFFCADDDSADAYASKTGLTFSAGELKVSKAGATEANAAGTASEVGGGWYMYEATAGEVDTLGVFCLRVVKTDVYSEMTQAMVVAFDPYSATSLGLTNLDATVSSRLASASYSAPSTLLTEASGVETGLTLQGALRLVVAAASGRRSGIGTGTELYRDYGNTKSRITMVFDANGNTTSVTYDPT
jgi:hypothetical protein